MMLIGALFASSALFASASASGAGNLQHRAYHTGEAIAKPMVMTGFVELSRARTIPTIEFTDIDGKPRKLNEYKGKLVVLNLWASWCAPCLREMPALKTLKRALADAPIEIVPLSLDDDPSAIPAFLERHGLADYVSWFDPGLKVEAIMPANVVPATYVFDGEGNLIGFVRGFLDWSDKESEAFLRALGEKYTGVQLQQLKATTPS
ncbi:TlpA family protein disulfide reductase [Shewanella sp. JM162201]|uniref:TlpA family protein disulfide reductase n=2 Tax=Shewanella jiangmenensis TaxID=2837387 RepID=A0ABS5V0V6_9GAMM|nr:TlpA family protein disulfide reductase [Shewanella jiangmenensis]